MAKRKKSGSAGGAVVIVLLAVLITLPAKFWIAIGVIAGFSALLYFALKPKAKVPAARPMTPRPPATFAQSSKVRASKTPKIPPTATISAVQAPVSIGLTPILSPTVFKLPEAPAGFAAGKWIPAGQTIAVAGISIPGGMLYIGTSLAGENGGTDPCLIDPSKSVAKDGSYIERLMNYWPSYSDVSPTARRAYLNWLVDGRQAQDANLGYVFLFFYGLERRVLVDGATDPVARVERAAIATEIRRLLAIYGETSGSFRGYAGGLLDWIALSELPPQLYERPIPALPRSFELPMYLRAALGQAVADRVPVPPRLALAWIRSEPTINLRTPAVRCAEQFEKAFIERYTAAFGAGMALPRNRTKLKFVYRAASSAFLGAKERALNFEGLPDISVLTAPLKKLAIIAEEVTKSLEAYSRFVGRNPSAQDTLEGVLQLPATLWPERARDALDALKRRMSTGMVVLSYQSLLTTLNASAALPKERSAALARALAASDIGFEPDILNGAKMPKPEDTVVLFATSAADPIRPTPEYQLAALTLQLASAIADADGDFSAKEIVHLQQQVRSWTHLTPAQQRRLMAHLRLLIARPVSVASLKKRLEPLGVHARETLATFMVMVAQSDGVVLPAEIQLLEKIYKLLGVDTKKVFSDVHAAAADESKRTALVPKEKAGGFMLDTARIEALQKDTEKVSALLAGIFEEELPEAVPMELESDVVTKPETSASNILGLDEAHNSLVRLLLSRPSWNRSDLLDAASDLDLMLDGALERINEASFDANEVPLVEGDDPLTINSEVMETLAA